VRRDFESGKEDEFENIGKFRQAIREIEIKILKYRIYFTSANSKSISYT